VDFAIAVTQEALLYNLQAKNRAKRIDLTMGGGYLRLSLAS
jgi:hypothetical protein